MDYDLTLPKAHHYAKHEVKYRFCKDPIVQGELDFSVELDNGATDWNNADVGFKFSSADQVAGCEDTDEVSAGFTQVYHVSHTEIEDQCGSDIAWACAGPSRRDGSHFTSHYLVYVHPPADGREWTNELSNATDNKTAFAESILTHELGHVAGLGHAKSSNTDVSTHPLMRDAYNYRVLYIKKYDRDAMRIIYKTHSYH